jgi:hypothetical protein
MTHIPDNTNNSRHHAEPDPIFAAIARHKALYAEWLAMIDADDGDIAEDADAGQDEALLEFRSGGF